MWLTRMFQLCELVHRQQFLNAYGLTFRDGKPITAYDFLRAHSRTSVALLLVLTLFARNARFCKRSRSRRLLTLVAHRAQGLCQGTFHSVSREFSSLLSRTTGKTALLYSSSRPVAAATADILSQLPV